MPSCKMDPKSVKLELVTLIVFTMILIATSVVPLFRGIAYIGLPLAITAAAFGIPAAKLPHHRAYAITAAAFAALSALCFVIASCLYIYALSVSSIDIEQISADAYAAINIEVAVTIAIIVFCTATTCALSVKTVQTAMYHRSAAQNLEAILGSRTPIVIVAPSDTSSYLKMPPPLPIGEAITMEDDLPPPYLSATANPTAPSNVTLADKS
ncbi:hypothetical protein CHUAL_013303 [Chamberlinius hualienensis]